MEIDVNRLEQVEYENPLFEITEQPKNCKTNNSWILPEIVLKIFKNLSNRDMVNFCCMNRLSFSITNREIFWKNFLPEIFYQNLSSLNLQDPKKYVLNSTVGSEEELNETVKTIVERHPSVTVNASFLASPNQNKTICQPIYKIWVNPNSKDVKNFDILIRNQFIPSGNIRSSSYTLESYFFNYTFELQSQYFYTYSDDPFYADIPALDLTKLISELAFPILKDFYQEKFSIQDITELSKTFTLWDESSLSQQIILPTIISCWEKNSGKKMQKPWEFEDIGSFYEKCRENLRLEIFEDIEDLTLNPVRFFIKNDFTIDSWPAQNKEIALAIREEIKTKAKVIKTLIGNYSDEYNKLMTDIHAIGHKSIELFPNILKFLNLQTVA